MWNYEKRLQHPVRITQTNPKIAQVIITQFGGLYCNNLYYIYQNMSSYLQKSTVLYRNIMC